MEESSDEDMWEKPEESPDEDMLEVDFDPVKDPYDPLDDEIFGECRGEWEQDLEGSDDGASEESFASVQEEEGADSDIELFEEPPQ